MLYHFSNILKFVTYCLTATKLLVELLSKNENSAFVLILKEVKCEYYNQFFVFSTKNGLNTKEHLPCQSHTKVFEEALNAVKFLG